MSALFVLIGASLSVAVGFLVAFLWSVRDGQYDDDYTPSVRMLFDTPKQSSLSTFQSASLKNVNPEKVNKEQDNQTKEN